MKKTVFNSKEYQIPTDWSDVTVDMLIKSAELSEILEDAPIIAIITSYTGIPIKELKIGNVGDVNEIISIMGFIGKPYEPKPDNGFDFMEVRYGCDPEIVNQSFQDWVSVQTALYNHREEPVKALPKLVAILCKREGETLDDFNLEERTNLFKHLPMTKAKDVEAFFLLTLSVFNTISQLSSMTNVQEELVLNKVKELQGTLKMSKGRDGISFGTRYAIGIYRIYLWWARKVLEKYYSSKPIKSSKKTWKQTFRKLLQMLRGKKEVSK